MTPVLYISQTNLNKMFFSACPKFCKSSAAIRFTPGPLFAFRPLSAFSNFSFQIESPISSFCNSFSFSMKSSTTTPLFRLYVFPVLRLSVLVNFAVVLNLRLHFILTGMWSLSISVPGKLLQFLTWL